MPLQLRDFQIIIGLTLDAGSNNVEIERPQDQLQLVDTHCRASFGLAVKKKAESGFAYSCALTELAKGDTPASHDVQDERHKILERSFCIHDLR